MLRSLHGALLCCSNPDAANLISLCPHPHPRGGSWFRGHRLWLLPCAIFALSAWDVSGGRKGEAKISIPLLFCLWWRLQGRLCVHHGSESVPQTRGGSRFPGEIAALEPDTTTSSLCPSDPGVAGTLLDCYPLDTSSALRPCVTRSPHSGPSLSYT